MFIYFFFYTNVDDAGVIVLKFAFSAIVVKSLWLVFGHYDRLTFAFHKGRWKYRLLSHVRLIELFDADRKAHLDESVASLERYLPNFLEIF